MKLNEYPESLQPFVCHGIDLAWREGDKEALGDCPFCDSPKLSISIKTGVWRCFACNEGEQKDKAIKGGNALTFIRRLWEVSFENTPSADYAQLATDRGYLYDTTLIEWQLARSIINNRWLIPAFGSNGSLMTLYQYILKKDMVTGKSRMMLLPTPTLSHHLFGVNLFNPACKEVFFCEGIWDAIALWEMLSVGKQGDGGYTLTSNRSASLLAESSVLATPGAMVFKEQWLSLFEGREQIHLMGQNDHPRTNEKTGELTLPASYNGMRNIVAQQMQAHGIPADKINWLKWGEEGFTPFRPSGYDVRDHLVYDS